MPRLVREPLAMWWPWLETCWGLHLVLQEQSLLRAASMVHLLTLPISTSSLPQAHTAVLKAPTKFF